MKFVMLSLLSFLSFQAVAQDYVKIQAENDSFRDFSREEFEHKFGENHILLPSYSCNQKDEFDPFHLPLRSSSQKNRFAFRPTSLKVILFIRVENILI